MDARPTSEQRQLRDAAAKLADELGPGSVSDLPDARRRARLEEAVTGTGFRELRSDGACGVEVAIVAEEFARGWWTSRSWGRFSPTICRAGSTETQRGGRSRTRGSRSMRPAATGC